MSLTVKTFSFKDKKISCSSHNSDVGSRDKALELITDLFGKENVIPISNYNQLQLRSLIKDLGRVYGIPYEELNRYTTVIEFEALSEAKKKPGFDKAVWVLDFNEAFDNSQTFRKLLEDYPEFAKNIQVLFKQTKSLSRHAGGVAITDNAYGNMPVIKSGGTFQAPWVEGLNNRHLENLGILKFDILGLGTLRMIESTIEKILKKETGKKSISFEETNKWYYENLHPDNNKMTDLHVYQNIYWEEKWAGIFQFINPSSQKFIQKMKPNCVADIAAATSIFRPGPLSANVDKLYLNNRTNPDKIKYKHPLLKEVLGPTYGCIIYQEQLQLIYHKLAGVPLEETDLVRKAFTKKDISNKEKAAQDRKNLRDDFVFKCRQANNIEETLSGDIFDELEKYVSYSFNLAHAIAYATISYQCLHGQTKIFDWNKKEYSSIAKAFREQEESNAEFTIACYDENTKQTIPGKVKKIIRTTGPKNKDLKMAYLLKTESGKSLMCSKDHPILTSSGEYKKLEELNIGDLIACEQKVTLKPYKFSEKRNKNISLGLKKSWASFSEEEKNEKMKPIQKAARELHEINKEKSRVFWKTLDPDKKRQRLQKMQLAAMNSEKSGWKGIYRGYAKCGCQTFSSNELVMHNWLFRNNLEHQSQVAMPTFGFADVYCKGIYIEFDGLNREQEYFEKKFGDLPYVVVRDKKNFDNDLNFLLQADEIVQGKNVEFEKITSIEQHKETVMYDISMENEPHNFLANNIVVHNCAHLLTYHSDEWITSYIDYCINDKGKGSGGEDPKDVALKEATALGYKLGKADINYSTHEYTCLDKTLVPSITSMKSVGKAVLYELEDYRPYNTVKDLLWNVSSVDAAQDTWRHSKLNKRALGALVKMESFDSLNLVGPEEDKMFKNYKQMHYVLVDKADELKKATNRKKNKNHRELLKQFIEESKTISDWSRQEKLAFKKEIAGMRDMDLVVTPEMKKFIEENTIEPLNVWSEKDKVYWAIIRSVEIKGTQKNPEKKYLKIKLGCEDGTDVYCNIWNFKIGTNHKLNENDVVVGSFDKNNFGFSTFLSKIYKLNQ